MSIGRHAPAEVFPAPVLGIEERHVLKFSCLGLSRDWVVSVRFDEDFWKGEVEFRGWPMETRM